MIHYDKILAGIQLGEGQALTAQAADTLATLLGAKQLWFVSVVDEHPALPPMLPVKVYEEAIEKARLSALSKLGAIETATAAQRSNEVRRGRPDKEILDAAKAAGANLIVLSSHQRSAAGRFIHGSVGGRLIRTSPIPIFVARHGMSAINRILVAVDLSEISEKVLKHAFAFAQHTSAKVKVVSCYEFPTTLVDAEHLLVSYVGPYEFEALKKSHKKALETLVERVRPSGVEVELEVSEKMPKEAIVESAALMRADMLVLGTSGHNAVHRFILGSVATHLIHQAASPVLVVPSP